MNPYWKPSWNRREEIWQEAISVSPVTRGRLKGWHSVERDGNVVAYLSTEEEANAYRFDLIRRLNPFDSD